jgi:predicted enzyme related to lactoylglutathione lyase
MRMADQGPKIGLFSWNELMTSDTKKACDFYTRLLGWTTTEMDMGSAGKYTVFKAGDTQVGGMMAIQKEWGNVPPHWMSYLTVKDVDDTAKKAEQLGAKILVPPTDIPGIGRFCTFCDPTGAAISVVTYLPMNK